MKENCSTPTLRQHCLTTVGNRWVSRERLESQSCREKGKSGGKSSVQKSFRLQPPVARKAFHRYLRLSWTLAVQHLMRLTTLVHSDLFSASSVGLPSASVNWQSAVSGGGCSVVSFKSVPPQALETVSLWLWGTCLSTTTSRFVVFTFLQIRLLLVLSGGRRER